MAKKKNPTDKLNFEKDLSDLFQEIQDQSFEHIDELQDFLE